MNPPTAFMQGVSIAFVSFVGSEYYAILRGDVIGIEGVYDLFSWGKTIYT